MDLHLKGKTVVVTGGGTGIGKAAVLEYLREGCNAAICGRRQETLDEAVAYFKAQGFDVFAETADATDYESIYAFAQHVKQKFGAINIWVNNEYVKSSHLNYPNLS